MNKIYRIYKEENFRYLDAVVMCSKRQMIDVLDQIITPDRFDKVLVIEHDSEIHADSTFYLYLGRYEEYLAFRETILMEQDKILEPYYEFVEPSKVKKLGKCDIYENKM